MKSERGQALLELLIAVSILICIAAAAVPSILQMQIQARERDAIAALKLIKAAELTYKATYGNSYAPSLQALGGYAGMPCTPSASTACLIDALVATNGLGNGVYGMNWSGVGAGNTMFITAVPIVAFKSANRSLCVASDGISRVDVTGAAISSENQCYLLPPIY